MKKSDIINALSRFPDDSDVKIVYEEVVAYKDDNSPKIVGYSEFTPTSIESSSNGIVIRVSRK
jgi:hypothetical protein